MTDEDFAETLLRLGMAAGMVVEMDLAGFLARLVDEMDGGGTGMVLGGATVRPTQVRAVALAALAFQDKVNRVFEVQP